MLRSGRLRWAALALGALAILVGTAAWLVHDGQMQARLLTTEPYDVAAHPDLVAYAHRLARPAYRKHCASCHGGELQGDHARGAPNLKDAAWLYGSGEVADIEQTILYGIRSGHAKARNITDMPALGRTMQLSPREVWDVESYVLSLSQPGQDPASVARGSVIFQNKGVCYDCHSGDGRGNPDYGAPDFTDTEWLYGGDRQTVFTSIYNGRHGRCPAWIGVLKPATIRALAVYIHQVSHQAKPGAQAHG